MTVLIVIGALILAFYILIFAVARAAGQADERLKRMWESDEQFRRVGGKTWR